MLRNLRTPSLGLALIAATFALTGCNPKPSLEYVQWVARDAWNAKCAEVAIVERFKQDNLEWVEEGKRAKVDVDATFKLGNDCEGLKAYEAFDFKMKGLEMVKCEAGGKEGWALAGKEDRCWTGPKLLRS